MYENLKPIVITNPVKEATYYAGDTVDVNFTINGLVSSADGMWTAIWQVRQTRRTASIPPTDGA